MSEIVLESVLVCPVCGFAKRETMPIKACQFFYECAAVRRCCAPRLATAASFVPTARRSVPRCRAKTATCRAVEPLRGVLLSRSRGPQLWLTPGTIPVANDDSQKLPLLHLCTHAPARPVQSEGTRM